MIGQVGKVAAVKSLANLSAPTLDMHFHWLAVKPSCYLMHVILLYHHLQSLKTVAVAFGPARMRMTMKADSMQSQISKALGIAAMGIALTGPMPAMADGAASKSTVYRARNSYGQRVLLGLGDAALAETSMPSWIRGR